MSLPLLAAHQSALRPPLSWSRKFRGEGPGGLRRRSFGGLHTTAPIPEIYVSGSRAAILQRWTREETQERGAHFSIRVTNSQAIYRGRVIIDGPLYVDVLQVALDVARHPARGEEQASYLLDHVLGWTD